MKKRFSDYKNIGPKTEALFMDAGLTLKMLDTMTTEEVFMHLVTHGEAEKVFQVPKIYLRVIWGAQHDRAFNDVPDAVLQRFNTFLADLL